MYTDIGSSLYVYRSSMYLDIVCYMHNSMLYCSIYTADTYIILLSSFAEVYRQSLSWMCCMICWMFTDMCGR